MSTKKYIIKALSLLSLKAIKEILEIIPEAKSKKKQHVPGIGIAVYFYGENKKCIAHAFKDEGKVVLLLKQYKSISLAEGLVYGMENSCF